MTTKKKVLKEDIDISQVIKQEISQVIDQWVNDLVKTKIATPVMNPKLQQGLWDRLKGSLSNIWHGRYNQNNPNYWKNRFGDDLGVQESYNPRAFSLQEYKEIRSAVEETEKVINEESTPEVEKLRIVRIIRSAAEDLKQKLYTIFVRSCPSTGDVATRADSEAGGGEEGTSGPVVRPITSPSEEPERPEKPEESEKPEEPSDLVPRFKSKERQNLYLAMRTKVENKSKPVGVLWSKRQYIDAILHEDFEDKLWDQKPVHSSKENEQIISKYLEDFLHDAKIKGENKRTIEKAEEAIKKFSELKEKSGL